MRGHVMIGKKRLLRKTVNCLVLVFASRPNGNHCMGWIPRYSLGLTFALYVCIVGTMIWNKNILGLSAP